MNVVIVISTHVYNPVCGYFYARFLHMRCTAYLCTYAVYFCACTYCACVSVSVLEIIVMLLHDTNIICCDSYAPRKNGSRCSCTGVVRCYLGTVLELAVCGR